jgi:hypothetical protein
MNAACDVQRDALVVRGVSPLAADDRQGSFTRRCVPLDQGSQAKVVGGGGLRTLTVVAIRMDADRIQVFEHAGLEQRLEKRPREPGRGGRQDHRLRIGFPNRPARRQRQCRVVPNVRLRLPETDIRLVPDLPQDASPLVMLGRRGGPSRKGRDAVRLARRRDRRHFLAGDRIDAGNRVFVQRIRVVEDIQRSQSAFLQVLRQFVVLVPVVLTLGPFGPAPGEIHADEFEPGGGDQVEVLFAAAHEMNVDSDTLGTLQARNTGVRGLRTGGVGQAADRKDDGGCVRAD